MKNITIKETLKDKLFNSYDSFAKTSLEIEGGLQNLITQNLDNDKVAKMKTEIGFLLFHYKDKLQDFNNNPVVKLQVVKSLIKIIRYGTVIPSEYIYLLSFAGKNPSASFQLQYQAEKKILSSNGYVDIETFYVLKNEEFKAVNQNGHFFVESHVFDMNKRELLKDQDFINEILCGYVYYTDIKSNKRFCLLIEKDKIEHRYKLSKEKTEERKKENLKYKFRQNVCIGMIHELFNKLINQDWSEEEYYFDKYQLENKQNNIIENTENIEFIKPKTQTELN
jgi:hypothetical protein